MAEGSQHVRQADIAGILAILTQTVNQQTQILEEIRTNQKQLSSLDARMVKLEGLMQGTSSGEPAPAPASSSLVNPAGIAEVVAGLSLTLKLAQSNISNASTAHILGQLQADRLQLPSNYKGKGKEVARDAPLEVTDSVQPQDTLIIGEQTTVSPEAKSYQDQDATAQSTGPPTPLSVPAKPLSVLSTTYSSDEPNVLSVSSQRKRKRRINQPRAVSASTLYGKEREVGGPEPSTSGPAAQKRKAEDAEPHSPSRAPRVRKLRRVEVLIMQNPRILERMRIATPLHEALEERRHASRAASPMDVDPYTEAFSSDLSDLSDLTESDVEEGENDTNGEDIATFVERGSEQEVEGQVLAMSDSSDDCQEDTAQEEQPASRPPRRSMLRPNYNYGDLADLGISMPLDEDSDYVPDKSQGDRAPGPSRRPQTRRADAVSPQPESFVGIPVSQTRPKSKPMSY
ncbi:hypothetical protein PHLGIDRAFT_456256 [Phlebiopsis gigantea 11061_1 CR5-6]|uniref:Uncharacterized protein n=1 Tax=Phlebiopsis gigantea (strain 11061_1 CR5-6) TaxID=745531 RepID=A0A0C3SF70_PHLG1|nr:hypothetical protein PHLGIDRAFT_456256 [Phlebiopsis gigantea 11061_1 CR5-6]